MRARGMVHKDLANLAKELAATHYEVLARDNRFYQAFPKVGPFVRKNWHHYTHTARQILIGMLGDPNRSEDQKAAIADVVLKDGAVNPKRMAAPQKPSFFLK